MAVEKNPQIYNFVLMEKNLLLKASEASEGSESMKSDFTEWESYTMCVTVKKKTPDNILR